MLLDLADASALVAQSFGRIVAAQFLDQVAGVPRDIPWEFDGVDSLQNDIVRPHGVGASEWGSARQQLEHQHSEGPVIGTDVVATVQDHLRGHVFWARGEGERNRVRKIWCLTWNKSTLLSYIY